MPQRVVLVGQKSSVSLQVFSCDSSDAHNIMDGKKHKSPQLIRHARRIILLKLHVNSKPVLVKPVGRLDPVDPTRVTNKIPLALILLDEIIMTTKLHHEKCEGPVQCVGKV